MSFLALGAPGPFELVLLLLVGLLLFGKRLPEVGRSIGQTVVQFKKGLNEVSEEASRAASVSSSAPAPSVPVAPPTVDLTPKIEIDPSSFKFDPHTGKPIER